MVYKHQCPDCNWETYRSKILTDAYCSKCGSTKEPIIHEIIKSDNVENAKKETDALVERTRCSGVVESACMRFRCYVVGCFGEVCRLSSWGGAILTPTDKFY
jgi:hypothetical protein